MYSIQKKIKYHKKTYLHIHIMSMNIEMTKRNGNTDFYFNCVLQLKIHTTLKTAKY